MWHKNRVFIVIKLNLQILPVAVQRKKMIL